MLMEPKLLMTEKEYDTFFKYPTRTPLPEYMEVLKEVHNRGFACWVDMVRVSYDGKNDPSYFWKDQWAKEFFKTIDEKK